MAEKIPNTAPRQGNGASERIFCAAVKEVGMIEPFLFVKGLGSIASGIFWTRREVGYQQCD